MSRPRDQIGYERGQAHRQAVRDLMLEHVRPHTLRRHLTVQQIQGRLLQAGIDLALSTVAGYAAEIYAEAEVEATRDLVLE